ncbi:hypothetical protein ACGFX7_05940 [Streptomyces harbinensis]|uniref:hypothetical protein n=1 Tax=Streptomyces harbinensis TaxID=1176198 RepID=UPI0037117B2F
MPTTMHDTTRAAEWLVSACRDPEGRLRWLASAGQAILPLGICWDAVRIPAGTSPLPPGPIAQDPLGALYALVPVGTAATWSARDTEPMGAPRYLQLPAPHRTGPPGIYWVQPPDGSGLLVDPDELHQALLGQVV